MINLSDNFFNNFILGVTSECIQVDTRKLNFDAALKLISAAQHQISIISRNLDPRIFNNEEIILAMQMHIRRTKNSNIKILVQDISPIIKNGHRILELSQRISSKIEIRKVCQEYSQYNKGFLVADSTAYIHNSKSDLYEAEVNFSDKDKSKELIETFKKIWEQSSQDIALRRLCV